MKMENDIQDLLSSNDKPLSKFPASAMEDVWQSKPPVVRKMTQLVKGIYIKRIEEFKKQLKRRKKN